MTLLAYLQMPITHKEAWDRETGVSLNRKHRRNSSGYKKAPCFSYIYIGDISNERTVFMRARGTNIDHYILL